MKILISHNLNDEIGQVDALGRVKFERPVMLDRWYFDVAYVIEKSHMSPGGKRVADEIRITHMSLCARPLQIRISCRDDASAVVSSCAEGIRRLEAGLPVVYLPGQSRWRRIIRRLARLVTGRGGG